LLALRDPSFGAVLDSVTAKGCRRSAENQMFEFEDPRLIRWLALFASLAIEGAAFWFGGPSSDPNQGFASNLVMKARARRRGLAWMGVVLADMAVARVGRACPSQARAASAVMPDERRAEYETGLHWLVLLRDIPHRRDPTTATSVSSTKICSAPM